MCNIDELSSQTKISNSCNRLISLFAKHENQRVDKVRGRLWIVINLSKKMNKNVLLNFYTYSSYVLF